MTAAKAYVKKLNAEQKEVHYTLGQITGYAAALGVYKMRRNVGHIRWGTFAHDKDLGVTVLVDVEGGKDLVPVTLWNIHKMSLKEYATAINDKIKKAKSGKDKVHKESTKMADFIPSFILEPVLFVCTYIAAVLQIQVPPWIWRTAAM